MVLGLARVVRLPLAAFERGLSVVDGRDRNPAQAVEELVEESVELVADSLGRHRRVAQDGDGHLQIDVRGITRPQERGLRDRLKRSLEQIDGVSWAEVNAVTGKVAVALHGQGAPLQRILGVVDGLESAYGVRRERLDERERQVAWDVDDRADHPADVEPARRAVAALAGDTLALGWAAAGRLARLARVPVELAGVVSVVDNHPGLRRQVERALGQRTADLVLPLANAFATGIAQGTTGLLVDMAYQSSLLGELRARRAVWQRREPEFYARPSRHPIEPPPLPPRPRPLPRGPVETASDRLALAGAAGFAATLAATRDPRRATDAFLASIPRAARLGREGFATQLGRTLAARGVVPLDGSALRRLDRVDTVVVDSDVLVTGRARVAAARTLGDLPPETIATLGAALLDPADSQAVREDGPWTLEPLDGLGSDVTVPRGARARGRELRRAGSEPLALHRDGCVEGLVGAAAELEAAADVLVAAVREAGHRLVVAGRKGRAGALVGADEVVARGKRLGEAIRRLQAGGAVVAAVGRRGKRGLAAADVGIGLTRRSGRPPWGADLVCGHDLADVAFLVDATVAAREASARGARMAAAGSGLGALAALAGPRSEAGSRCLAIVNGAAGASLASGTWTAVELARRPRPVATDPTPWHELDAAAVLEALATAPGGLPADLARERRRARRRDEPEVGALEPFLAELANPLNPVLGVGAALAAATGSVVDAALVGGLVGANTLVGGIQRLRTDRAVADLLEGSPATARVLRGGREDVVAEHELVPGDVIRLAAGDAVPADCRILGAEGLEVDESTLTGESFPVAKSAEPAASGAAVPERASMLYEDTTISAGHATAAVVATGAATEVARSVAGAGGPGPAPGGVEQRLEELTRRILPPTLAAAGGVAVVGLLRRWPLRELASTGVTLAVASVPEGLPLVASAGQLAAARRLSRRGVIVRNPRTVEALGRVEVLCCDKTGTLTEGRISLRLLSDGERTEAPGDGTETARRVLAAALRATAPEEDGDATDRAVREAARDAGVAATAGVGGFQRVAELPFEANRGLHAVLGRCRDGQRLSVKGAPESVLPACSRWRRRQGTRDFDRVALAEVEARVDELAARGYRVLAVAERLASDRTELGDDRIEGLELAGLLALADPVRQTAAEAVAGIREAGVRVVMVTGDHPSTARAVAAELGLDEPVRVLTGAELDGLDDGALADRVDGVDVFARVSPAQKGRIVAAFQRRGTPVAMTGDGANDAASIRLADVGVALGTRATPAARDAADAVVTDDRVETLIDAIAEGRALWGSVREALGILVGGNLGEIGFTVTASLFSRRAPVNARQLLLVNLVTDLAPALAVAVRPPADRSTQALLREGPEESLGAALTRDIAVRAVATGLAGTAAWTAARLTGTRRRAGTVGLVAVVGTQLGQTLLAGRGRGPLVTVTAVGSAAALAGIVQTPGLSRFFGCRPLGPLGWAQATSAAVAGTVGSYAAGRLLLPRPA